MTNKYPFRYILQHSLSKRYLGGTSMYPCDLDHPMDAKTFWNERSLKSSITRHDNYRKFDAAHKPTGVAIPKIKSYRAVEHIDRYDILCIDKDMKIVFILPVSQLRQKIGKLPANLKDIEK